ESELADVWGQLLGVDGLGRHDDFFALGGHSLIAVRLSAEVRKRFGVDLPLSALFEASTIERLAKLLPEPQAAESRGRVLQALRPFTPLVPIKPSGSARPLFCVAGQGGNPMHLRSLAQHLGAERPFYGLQHRGLDGHSPPYASVEEMADDFVRHIRELTPGPYLIAGYSGGGTAAFEMARQLLAAGCGVDGVILLDSFCPVEPELGMAWRLRLHLDGLRKEGPAYARRRIAARLSRYLRHERSPVQQSRSMFEIAASNWQAIENRYRPQPLAAAAYLFRVQSEDENDARYFAERYGGWNALFRLSVQQHVVPGTHVSMCEEPNVQVLAQKLRAVLDDLDATARAAQ
ncbi:MAG TPA: thioesterase domain-containing protein, partial [Polyangiales bacterium]|nr:thioesterase domain-containing protein [Polyangiales bacterium]